MDSLVLDKEYVKLVAHLKERIKSAQLKAALAVNQELINLYWYIGHQILEKQKQAKWGSAFIENLSSDLQHAFPETAGFSPSNLKRMRIFAELYPDVEISAQSVRQLPWGHIIVLIQKVKVSTERNWYAEQTISEGWARSTLEKAIKSDLYQRQAINDNKTSNYLERLPTAQSLLAQDILRNPYNFDFLGLHKEALEREIEQASIEHITKFLLEMGKGFAFVGSQVPLVIGDQEFFIDMLFYHLKLHSFVVVEIKATAFKPEHAGQLNFYLSAVDDLIKTPQDAPTIGLLLCKSRNKVVAEYALKSIEKPIGISEFELTKAIPDKLKTSLPTIAEIEQELSAITPEKEGV